MGLLGKLSGNRKNIKVSAKSLSKMTDDKLEKLEEDAFWEKEDMQLTEQIMRM